MLFISDVVLVIRSSLTVTFNNPACYCSGSLPRAFILRSVRVLSGVRISLRVVLLLLRVASPGRSGNLSSKSFLVLALVHARSSH